MLPSVKVSGMGEDLSYGSVGTNGAGLYPEQSPARKTLVTGCEKYKERRTPRLETSAATRA